MKANQYIARTLDIIDSLNQIQIDIPLLIMSHPGFGKTSTLSMYCKYKDYNLYTLIVSQYGSDDILGLQTLKDGKLVRITPSWFDEMISLTQNNKRTILFLDEITCVDEWIQGPLLDLIFSRKFCNIELPENLLIVAAGNYSRDLNNAFKMTAPLINRFLILNIRNSDFEVSSFFDDDFEDVGIKEAGDYLGLKTSKRYFDIDKFKDWAKTSGEISFGRSEYSEDAELGLLGFTSIRSLNYSMKFAEAYIVKYGKDPLWMRIVGDTLGYSSTRTDKTMHSILKGCAGKFIIDAKPSLDTIEGKCNKILNSKEIDVGDIESLEMLLESTPPENLTAQEVKKLSAIIKYSFSHEELKELADLIISKTSSLEN